jgi:hypothetical protein
VVGVDGPVHADVPPALAGLADPTVDLARFVLSGVLLLLVHPDSRARIDQVPAGRS